jgi:aspartyl-tRNA(Asn)/glutamyl-tRNA(Gln) amidotransferase subunit A
MDHVGSLCRSVEDARLVYDVLRGEASSPPATVVKPADLRLGVLRDYFTAVLDPQVALHFDRACARLRGAGVRLQNVNIPHAGDIAPIYLHIVLAEAAAYHAKTLESRPDDYTPGVRVRLEMGRYILAEDYVRALRGRELLTREVDQALNDCDGLLLPSLAVPAFKIGTTSVHVGGSDESIRNITLRLTQLFDITGHPAITIPCGATPEGLPVGAQLVGHASRTSALLDVAQALEPHVRGDSR